MLFERATSLEKNFANTLGPEKIRRSQFFKANFDGFWQFSQKVLKIQKLYIPHWKALIFSSLEQERHGAWLTPKNRYATFNESRTVFTKKVVAGKWVRPRPMSLNLQIADN